jgi:chromosome segregation protein
VHLRSISLKGFKSFPDRTRLDFTPGVSVIVGPNGSGKSNVTDAVLWAMGEQSPLAVRGQSMQDVIFGGARGVQARSSAEVEIVLDNGDGTLDMPMGEISILRRLDRNGEGEYRLNGARCRLVDVLEVLSDTGLGKEMHSIVSQGRVETIVTSKPRERRLLIEEAAGLGKHRKRRRRAQLKLDRTQDNLDRALDVEREARSRLRPLKRQAEAAELHERLERQSNEARWELARNAVRARRAELEAVRNAAAQARTDRDRAGSALAEVAARREQAEAALAQRSEQREALVLRAGRARSAAERIDLRAQRVTDLGADIGDRLQRRGRQLDGLREQALNDRPDAQGRERIEALEAELASLDEDRTERLERELATLADELSAAAARVADLAAACDERRAALAGAEAACESARRERRAAEGAADAARREAARVGGQLAAANQFLRTHAPSGGDEGAARSLADDLEVEPGFELALSAALGGRLGASIAGDLAGGRALLDSAGTDGGQTLIADSAAPGAAASPRPPAPGARALTSLLRGPEPALGVARRLLIDAWVVEDLDQLPPAFVGIAVTRSGRAWLGAVRELRQAARGGSERVLAERNRRDALVAESEQAVRAERAAHAAVEVAVTAVQAADAARDGVDREAREADRARSAAQEEERRVGWLIEQRRAAPDQGEGALRRAQVAGELAAERRVAERAARDREERAARIASLEARIDRDGLLVPRAERLALALGAARDAVAARLEVAEAELATDRQAGEGVTRALRACAEEEAGIQTRLRVLGDALTAAEVRAQQVRDQEAEATATLEALAERLGLAAEPASEALDEAEVTALGQRIERLARRREQLGPVNPLAKAEYDEAVAHVEELEGQRTDLETALRELGTLIRETDRQIRETFEQTFNAAAEHFERLSGELFPGGRGRLRLVREDAGPRPVLGGQEAAAAAASEREDAAEAEAAEQGMPGDAPDDGLGVEIEITPAGKAMKRLSLLSGGEKSMTAIAFLFAVFLAKPCPFYILDEVEAALDDLNIGRFLTLLRANAGRAQFIVVTHQKRTMEAADTLYGVSMGDDGVSKVISRHLPREVLAEAQPARGAA